MKSLRNRLPWFARSTVCILKRDGASERLSAGSMSKAFPRVEETPLGTNHSLGDAA